MMRLMYRIGLCVFFGLLAFGQARPLIGVGGIVHETNTFNPKKTGLAEFAQGIGGADGILRGKDMIAQSAKAGNTMAGFIYGASKHGFDLQPSILAGPQTMGTVLDLGV